MNAEVLNNEIVLMRKYVKQARVHMVTKLVRKVELFHKRKGTNEMKQKCDRKADRLLEEILTLKKLKDDAISKFALFGSQCADSPSSDPRQRVLRKIASYRVLVNQVVKFREKWPDWHKTVPKSLLASKSESLHVKENKTSNEKSLVSKPKRVVNKKVKNPTKHHLGTIVAQKGMAIKKQFSSDIFKENVTGTDCDKDEYVPLAVSNKYLHSLEDVEEENGIKNISSAQGNKSRTRKKSVLGISHNASDYLVSGTPETKNAERHDKSLTFTSVAKDPFFMGSEDVQVEDTAESRPNSTPVNSDGLNRRQRRLALHTSNAKNKSLKSHGKDAKNKEIKQTVKIDRQHHAAASVSLHPSWEAKKRLQEQQMRLPFQGKKIKFSND